MSDSTELLCHRCGRTLEPGRGSFYVVRIEAFADPTGPVVTRQEMDADIPAEIDRLIEELRGSSERELHSQVHRRLTLHLCGPCYTDWIEDPAPGE